MIEQLPSLTPDATRNARTLARCRQRITRRRQRHEPASPERLEARRRAARYAVERNALLGFGVIYMSSVAFTVLQVLIR